MSKRRIIYRVACQRKEEKMRRKIYRCVVSLIPSKFLLFNLSIVEHSKKNDENLNPISPSIAQSGNLPFCQAYRRHKHTLSELNCLAIKVLSQGNLHHHLNPGMSKQSTAIISFSFNREFQYKQNRI